MFYKKPRENFVNKIMKRGLGQSFLSPEGSIISTLFPNQNKGYLDIESINSGIP
jgi:hypothetical protein